MAKYKTEIKRTIEMNTDGKAILIWSFAIRALHNALIEDGFDKLENNFSNKLKKQQNGIFWLDFLENRLEKKDGNSTGLN